MSPMPGPREVFEEPKAFWSFLTTPRDVDFEGQHFDRKEVGRPGPDGRLSKRDLKQFRTSEVAPTISAFANSNRDGGLLVLGIASNGAVAGLGHLDEAQRAALANPSDIVVGHASSVRFHPCTNQQGRDDEICLIFVPYADRAVCGTHDHRAWERRGPANIPMSPERLDAVRREKRVVEHERQVACVFDPDDLERGVLGEFRASALAEVATERSDQDLLRSVGALDLGPEEVAELTVAGALFFMANPQRVMPWATIRLVRYGVPLAQKDVRGLPDFDREISGPITSQIWSFRGLIRDAGFFKTYQRRRESGGFADEPELPEIALDEAVVNAVAHRDYAIKLPILCEKYTDAFVVHSPGEVRQARDVPHRFTLADRELQSAPRNPFLMRWLRAVRDTHGRPYVQALAEGTRRMQSEMTALGLPAPMYELNDGVTTLTLISNAPEREAAFRQSSPTAGGTEFTNLFALVWTDRRANGREVRSKAAAWRHDLLESLRERFEANGWYAEHANKGRLTAHRKGDHVSAPPAILEIVRLFPAYTLQVREYGGRAMKYTLLDIQRAESVFRREHASYSASYEALHIKARSTRVSLRIEHVTADGFVATTSYQGLTGWTCTIRVGDAADTKTDGVIVCALSQPGGV